MVQMFISRKQWFSGSQRFSQILLAVAWLTGLVCGSVFSVSASDPYLLLMRRAASVPVSIVGLLACVFLPFLFTAMAVYISKPQLIYPISFLKAFSFSLCACAVSAVFGSAGWLVRFLIQFSDACCLPVLCWFSLRHICGDRSKLLPDFILCVMLMILIGYLDYNLVSPFLAMLIEN